MNTTDAAASDIGEPLPPDRRFPVDPGAERHETRQQAPDDLVTQIYEERSPRDDNVILGDK